MSENLLLVVLGIVAPWLINFIKFRLGWTGNRALVLTGVISTLLAAGVLFYTGELQFSLVGLFGGAAKVFALATLAYKFILSKDDTVTISETPANQ